MFAPDARHGHLSLHPFAPYVIPALAMLVVLASALVLITGGAMTGSLSGGGNRTTALQLRSVAYIVPEAGEDVIYVRDASAASSPRPVGSFPRALSLSARGAASPNGDRLAVLHLSEAPTLPARLTFISLPSGAVRDVDSGFDYLSGIAWSPTGARLAATRTEPSERPSGQRLRVVEIDATTLASRDVATFEGAQQAVPVGYTPDGQRLYVAVIDQSGSSLWSVHDAVAQRVARLSDGPTRDWSLSPDGTRIAFVERIGVGERRYAGRLMTIAARRITEVPLQGDQLGTAWRPDSLSVDFGGPGGSLRLDGATNLPEYVIPQRWSPDGSMLAGTVYTPRVDATTEPSEYVEIMSEGQRLRLADVQGTRFIGFVRAQ